MRLNAHLSFHGQCEEAFRFYEKCLGGKIAFALTYGESPMAGDASEEQRGRILHMRLDVQNDILTGADSWPAPEQTARNITIALHYKDGDEAERVFHALAEGGAITMPIQKMFWTSHFGMLTDRFGVPWMVNAAA